MAKRPIKKPVKKSASASKKTVLPARTTPDYPCKIGGCKKVPAYMRVEKPAHDPDGRSRYCADHWKSVVEAKNKAAYKTVERMKEVERKRIAKKAGSKRRKVKIKK